MSAIALRQQLPRVLIATFAVVLIPLVSVKILEAVSGLQSPLLSVAVVVALSFAGASAGAGLLGAPARFARPGVRRPHAVGLDPPHAHRTARGQGRPAAGPRALGLERARHGPRPGAADRAAGASRLVAGGARSAHARSHPARHAARRDDRAAAWDCRTTRLRRCAPRPRSTTSARSEIAPGGAEQARQADRRGVRDHQAPSRGGRRDGRRPRRPGADGDRPPPPRALDGRGYPDRPVAATRFRSAPHHRRRRHLRRRSPRAGRTARRSATARRSTFSRAKPGRSSTPTR